MGADDSWYDRLLEDVKSAELEDFLDRSVQYNSFDEFWTQNISDIPPQRFVKGQTTSYNPANFLDGEGLNCEGFAILGGLVAERMNEPVETAIGEIMQYNPQSRSEEPVGEHVWLEQNGESYGGLAADARTEYFRLEVLEPLYFSAKAEHFTALEDYKEADNAAEAANDSRQGSQYIGRRLSSLPRKVA